MRTPRRNNRKSCVICVIRVMNAPRLVLHSCVISSYRWVFDDADDANDAMTMDSHCIYLNSLLSNCSQQRHT